MSPNDGQHVSEQLECDNGRDSIPPGPCQYDIAHNGHLQSLGESRQSQKSDIKAATEELKTLEIEIKDERGLLEAAVQRAGMLVSEELSLHDSAYYLVMQRVDHLKVATELAKRSADTASGLTDMLSTLGKQSEQADKLDRDQTDLVVRGEQVKND